MIRIGFHMLITWVVTELPYTGIEFIDQTLNDWLLAQYADELLEILAVDSVMQ